MRSPVQFIKRSLALVSILPCPRLRSIHAHAARLFSVSSPLPQSPRVSAAHPIANRCQCTNISALAKTTAYIDANVHWIAASVNGILAKVNRILAWPHGILRGYMSLGLVPS